MGPTHQGPAAHPVSWHSCQLGLGCPLVTGLSLPYPSGHVEASFRWALLAHPRKPEACQGHPCPLLCRWDGPLPGTTTNRLKDEAILQVGNPGDSILTGMAESRKTPVSVV